MLLYEAGDAGYLALREIRKNPDLDLEPVGFVDDDPDEHECVVHGLPVFGSLDQWSVIAPAHGVDQVIISFPI